MNEAENTRNKPTTKQRVEARVRLLHSLGREAVDVWDAIGNPIPVPELSRMKLIQQSIGELAIIESPTFHACANENIDLPPLQRMPGNGSFA